MCHALVKRVVGKQTQWVDPFKHKMNGAITLFGPWITRGICNISTWGWISCQFNGLPCDHMLMNTWVFQSRPRLLSFSLPLAPSNTCSLSIPVNTHKHTYQPPRTIHLHLLGLWNMTERSALKKLPSSVYTLSSQLEILISSFVRMLLHHISLLMHVQ